MAHERTVTRIPTQWVGPLHFHKMHEGSLTFEALDIQAPLATYETTLFHSVGRGAKVTRLAQTLQTTIVKDVMTRSLLFEAPSSHEAVQITHAIQANVARYQADIVAQHSQYAQLIAIEPRLVGRLMYLRMGFSTGDAAGHNMSTFASDAIASVILNEHPSLRYLSVSGNYCVDKKVSAVNSILGRGKHVTAEIVLTRALLETTLRTTPEALIELNLKKNLIGSVVSGGLMSANAHYANMLLGFYLATGQDAANIVEGSQGITQTQMHGDDLVFSVTLPNIIVGSVGHGKDAPDSALHLKQLQGEGPQGANRLAHVAAGLVLCGELSLMAALTNPNELVKSHKAIERKA